jgi:hypothetical protein
MRWALLVLALIATTAHAEPEQKAVLALVVGVNHSLDRTVADLRYADDDAAQYLALFRALGAKAVLLGELDDNTRRVHPQAAAEARPPSRAELEKAFRELAADAANARQRGVTTVLYVVYAGHGEIADGRGVLTLRDQRIGGRELAALVASVGADHKHLIVDACYSYFVANERGAGGRRRALSGFSGARAVPGFDGVGLLLSTSAGVESHEWEGFQAGVFSHEVRSGLAGAADADTDGQVTYREIAAFVERANAAIPNERFRPTVYARPPPSTGDLFDLRTGLGRALEIDGSEAGHYVLEDSLGVRWAQLHNAKNQLVRLVRPAQLAPLYLRRLDDDRELAIPPSENVVRIRDLAPSPPRARVRGAAHDSFGLVFSLPFDEEAVRTFVPPSPPPIESPPTTRDWRLIASTAAVIAGLGTASVGVRFTLRAHDIRDATPINASQQEVAQRNRDIAHNARIATTLYVAGGAAVAAGVIIYLWPRSKHAPVIAATPGGVYAGYSVEF